MGTKNIKKDTSLRKAILQAAITGQLGISNVQCAISSGQLGISETGKQLLDRIIAERNAQALAEWGEKVKVNAKAKKPAPIVASEIYADEIPFEIPENWCWCRIDDLFAHNSGKALNKSENKEGTELEYITTSNLYWNYFDLDNLRTMLFKDSEIEKCTVRKGDLLVCEGGEVGRTAIWNFDRTICIQNHIHRLRAYEASLNIKFYYYVLFLYKEGKIIDNYAKGIGIKGLSSNALGSIVIPLPPLAEQNAIAAKLEEVLPLVEIYENAVLQKAELKSTLSDKIKKAILQEAVTGKLGIGNGQLGIGESGKQLLDRIIRERNAKAIAEWEEALKKNPKAKKPAPIVASEIDEDEIPFEVPENWCWCRLGDIFFMQAGKTISSSNIYEIQSEENPYPCFGGNGLRGYVSNFNKEGSFPIIGRQGALCGCINIATGKFYATEHAVVVDYFGICNYQWASWFLTALNLNQYATATAQPGLAVNKIETVLIPLPPLAVQNAIVAKIQELLPLCEHIEN